MATRWGRDLFGADLFGVDAASTPTLEIVDGLYRLEVRNDARTLLAELPYWARARWTKEVNVPSLLDFEYPLDDAAATYLTFPYLIWLYDKTGTLKDRFRVVSHTKGAGVDGLSLVVQCKGLLGQLGPQSGVVNYFAVNELQSVTISGSPTGGTYTLTYAGATTAAIAYDASAADVQAALEALGTIQANNITVRGANGGPWYVEFVGTLAATNLALMTASGAGLTGGSSPDVTVAQSRAGAPIGVTVGAILGNLLSLQSTNLQTITLGHIDAAIRDTAVLNFRAENMRILEAINALHDIAGGWFRVNSGVSGHPRFEWRVGSGQAWRGQEITLEKNASAMRVSTDYESIRTSVKVIGEGTDADTWTSGTATNATGIAAYGTITEVVARKNIRDGTDAAAVAQTIVDELAVPRKQYEVDAIDLSYCDVSRLDYSDEALDLGTQVRVISTDLGENIKTTVIKIARDLAAPMGVAIEVGDPAAQNAQSTSTQKDVIDVLADLLRQADDLSMRDSGIADSIYGHLSNPADTRIPLQSLAEDMIGEDIQAVGSANSAGAGMRLARDTHIHAGIPLYTAATKGSLSSVSPPALGYTTGDDHLYACLTSGTWTALDVLENT